jgi:uncharacterized protein (TIGR02444 family)
MSQTPLPTGQDPSGQDLPRQAFWEFSLRVYAQPGVQEECLDLQERLRLDVNLLLFCAYAGAKLRIALSPQDIAGIIALTEAWHNAIVRELRAVRTTMKRWSEDKTLPISAPAAALRLAVKKAELDAERIEHDLLAAWAAEWTLTREGRATQAPQEAVAANIGLLLDHYTRSSGETAAAPRQLIAAALSER